MGYETTLLFVEGYAGGYQHILATVEMGKIAYEGSAISKVIDLREKDSPLRSELAKLETTRTKIYDHEGNYTNALLRFKEDKRERIVKTFHADLKKIEEKLPYVYHKDQSKEQFTDPYGSLLIVASIHEVGEALKHDQQEDQKKGEREYTPYAVALAVVEQFKKSKDHLKVVLWGH